MSDSIKTPGHGGAILTGPGSIHDERVFENGIDSDRLSTGMALSEAVMRGCNWWSNSGSKFMLQNKRRQAMEVGSRSDVKTNGIELGTLDPESDNYLPSNLIAGEPWDRLTKREKIAIVRIWHNLQIRRPDMLGIDIETPVEMGEKYDAGPTDQSDEPRGKPGDDG